MRVAIVIVVAATIAAVWLVAKSRAQSPPGNQPDATTTKAPEPNGIYIGLRNTMLQGSRSKFSLAATARPSEPWGVLMDWGIRNGTGTVVVLSDGSASVDFRSCGGHI